ncbi:MAG: cytochrome c biogenesis protein CcsA [Bifidobacteriaceae bacterium]|jgi:ABC-type transport system involved in cytochrome c biogenesis permease subunit|nr:cytochrome c biogenesis protein CcsA [Bifidobacteriaceae bacterium]
MPDPLELAEYVLPAALILIAIALVANIVILSARRATAPGKVKVGPAGAVTTAEAANSDAALAADGAEPAAGVEGPPRAPSGTKTASRGRRASGGLAAYATGFVLIAFVLITVYLGVRMAATGHGPFANQHEFAVSFVWGILLAYLVVEWKLKLRAVSVAVLPVAACLTLYAMRLDAGVDPLVPALQNNLLLTLHVGFAILAYGAACVSFGAAVLYLVQPRWRRLKARPETLDEVGYKAAVVTFPLLTIMIVLGALWADTAWGSYWSWDPKETAALVTWLIYGAFLHARVARGWRGKRAAWLLVIGFAAILFAYFGNHFFGGLHSYA